MNIKTIGLGIGLAATVLCSTGCKWKKQQNHINIKPKAELIQQPKVDTLEILQKQLTKAKYAMIDSIDVAMKKAAKLPKKIH